MTFKRKPIQASTATDATTLETAGPVSVTGTPETNASAPPAAAHDAIAPASDLPGGPTPEAAVPEAQPATSPLTHITPPESETAPGRTVVVSALQPQRWRIGRPFGKEPTTIPLGELTDSQLAALLADPLLSVHLIDAPY